MRERIDDELLLRLPSPTYGSAGEARWVSIGCGDRVIRARPGRVPKVRCRQSAGSRQNQRVRRARRLRAVRFASISSEAWSAWLGRYSRSCWLPSVARSRSCSCCSPRSSGGAALRVGSSACSARSPMTAPGAAVPAGNHGFSGGRVIDEEPLVQAPCDSKFAGRLATCEPRSRVAPTLWLSY